MDCIGTDNKKKNEENELAIKRLEVVMESLKKEVESYKRDLDFFQSRFDYETIHRLEIEVAQIKSSLEELRNNNTDNKNSINDLKNQLNDVSEAIQEIYSKVEEYIEANTEAILTNREIKQELKPISEYISMKKAEEYRAFKNVFKRWMEKSKINKTIGSLIYVLKYCLIIFMIITIYIGIMNVNSGEELWKMLIELITAVRGG